LAGIGGENGSLGRMAWLSCTVGCALFSVLVPVSAHSTIARAPRPPAVAKPLKSGVLRKYSVFGA
jgi:hypothetical protein